MAVQEYIRKEYKGRCGQVLALMLLVFFLLFPVVQAQPEEDIPELLIQDVESMESVQKYYERVAELRSYIDELDYSTDVVSAANFDKEKFVSILVDIGVLYTSAVIDVFETIPQARELNVAGMGGHIVATAGVEEFLLDKIVMAFPAHMMTSSIVKEFKARLRVFMKPLVESQVKFSAVNFWSAASVSLFALYLTGQSLISSDFSVGMALIWGAAVGGGLWEVFNRLAKKLSLKYGDKGIDVARPRLEMLVSTMVGVLQRNKCSSSVKVK